MTTVEEMRAQMIAVCRRCSLRVPPDEIVYDEHLFVVHAVCPPKEPTTLFDFNPVPIMATVDPRELL